MKRVVNATDSARGVVNFTPTTTNHQNDDGDVARARWHALTNDHLSFKLRFVSSWSETVNDRNGSQQ
jgi:hypothetical protein